MSRILYDLQRDGMANAPRYLDNKNARITVLGDSQSGKTSFILRCVADTFTQTDSSFRMEDIYHTKINLSHLAQDVNKSIAHNNNNKSNQIINVHMLDTEEFEIADFSDIRNEQILQSDAFIICFDLTNIESFSDLRTYQRRIERVRGLDDPIPIIIAATKSDLIMEQRVSIDDIKQTLTRFEINYETNYFEISSKLNINIKQTLFRTVTSINQYKESQRLASSLASPRCPSAARSPSTTNAPSTTNTSSIHNETNDNETIQSDMHLLNEKIMTKNKPVQTTGNITNIGNTHQCCIIC